MIAAKPITIAPLPILISAKPWYCAISPPLNATRPLLKASPITFIRLILIPCALDISGLLPVARIAEPCSVPKYQYMIATTITAHTSPVTIAFGTYLEEIASANVLTEIALLAANPIIARLIDHKANCVRIPERMAGIPSFVCKKPVTRPASNPAKKETITASHGFHPPIINITATAPPVVNVPSTVISAKFNIRNVM